MTTPAVTMPQGTMPDALDTAVGAVSGSARRWARLPLVHKVALLERVRSAVVANAEAWVQTGATHKRLDPSSAIVGSEEWLAGVYPVLTLVSDYVRSLHALAAGEDLLDGVGVRQIAGGQLVVRTHPTSGLEAALTRGQFVDTLLEPSVTRHDLNDQLAAFYRQAEPSGRVTAVLGAGNYAAIPATDALTYLVVHGDAVVLKMNPVNEAYGPVIESMLAPLVDEGCLRIVYGGADVGDRLVNHPLVDAVHLTGSEATYNAIVFGRGPDGEKRRRSDRPRLDKPVCAELGGASPTIVLPGSWDHRDLVYQAQHVASQALHNAGHACISAQVLVLPARWPQREGFLDALREAMHTSPGRHVYYPHTEHRRELLHRHSPDAERHGPDGERSMVVGLTPSDEHPAFTGELFGPMLVVVDVDGGDAADYLSRAVAFANDRLYGTLGANVIAKPSTTAALGPAFVRELMALRYGAVAVNTWSAFVFGAPRAAWGAYPGNPRNAIGSGSGFVHNSLMLPRPQRNIAVAPFRDVMTPPWFLSNPRSLPMTRAAFRLAADSRPRGVASALAEVISGR